MSEAEKITTLIGEFVSTEIEDVKEVKYTKEKEKLTAFTIIMKSGKQYILAISEIA